MNLPTSLQTSLAQRWEEHKVYSTVIVFKQPILHTFCSIHYLTAVNHSILMMMMMMMTITRMMINSYWQFRIMTLELNLIMLTCSRSHLVTLDRCYQQRLSTRVHRHCQCKQNTLTVLMVIKGKN